MNKYKQGDLVWINYPYSDNFSQSKRRPAIIVSNDISNSLDDDYLLCPITSNLRNDSFSFRLENEHLSRPLPKISEVRCNKIVTVRESIIIAKFASLLPSKIPKLIEIIKTVFVV
jgi:mRNA interferase MazF